MGERHFRKAMIAFNAERYERAIQCLHATILTGFSPAEARFELGRVHLEIVNTRISTLSPVECRRKDIRQHLTASIIELSKAVMLRSEFIGGYLYLGIAYALYGD